MFTYTQTDKLLDQSFKHLLNVRLATGTRSSYSSGFRRWQTFCDFRNYDYLTLNNEVARQFVCYMHAFLEISGDNADKTLTAVTSTLLERGVIYIRNPLVSGIVKGFKIDKPPIYNETKPLSVYHLRYMIKWCIKKGDFTDWALSSAILIAFFGIMRPGEVTAQTTTAEFILTRGQVQFHPNMDNSTDLVVTLNGSKTNRTGKKEIIMIGCYCKVKMCNVNVPCPLHHVLTYAKARDGLYGNNLEKPFLI